MPDHAEPPQPPRPERHYFRRVLFSLTLLLLAITFVIFKWGGEENLPGIAVVWKLHGELLYDQIRYGRDKPGTLNVQGALALTLFARGSYPAAENQWKALLASTERVRGTTNSGFANYRLWLASCLFLEGK